MNRDHGCLSFVTSSLFPGLWDDKTPQETERRMFMGAPSVFGAEMYRQITMDDKGNSLVK